MLRMQRVLLTKELWDDILILGRAHWQELGLDKELGYAFDPPESIYAASQEVGALRVYTLMDREELVGYSVFFVRQSARNTKILCAAHDALYIRQQFRGISGVKFMRWCDEQLQAEGVELVSQNSRHDHPTSRILEHLGYDARETVYTRRLNPSSPLHNTKRSWP